MLEFVEPDLPTVACEYCGAHILKRELTHHQSFDCALSELRIQSCPKGCGQNIQARDLDRHTSLECPLESVPCDFQLIGCPRRLQRRSKEEHNTECLQYHLGLMNKSSLLTDERMAGLERTLRSRELDLAALQRKVESERNERLEMMQMFQDKIQILLDVFEEKLQANSSLCLASKKTATVDLDIFFEFAKSELNQQFLQAAASNVDSVRQKVDSLILNVRNIEISVKDIGIKFVKGQVQPTVRGENVESAPLALEPSSAQDLGEPSGSPVTTILRVHLQNGPHHTIGDALLEAKIGDKIVVSPGRYREALRINKAIQIIGDGHLSDVIIESNGKDTVIAETEFGSLSKITLRQKGDGFWSCVDIIAGQFNVEGCDVSSKSLTCISIHRKDTKSRIWRNRIHDCGGTGIFVFDGAKPLIEDNEIYDNAQSGIEITEGSDPEVKFNRIRGNAQHGVLVHDNGKGVLTDNEIYKNGLAGIEVRESGHARIHRNKIYSHDTSGGIYVHHYGRADIEKNDIYQNGLSGIACWQSGKPVCRLNRITANGEHGVHVRDGGWGTYEDNDVRANGRGGIRVAPDCALKVILNRNLVD